MKCLRHATLQKKSLWHRCFPLNFAKLLRKGSYRTPMEILCRDIEVHWPIGHIMSKINFMKYLPPLRPKLVPKLKMLRVYWNLAHLIFQTCWSRFGCQKVFWLNIQPPVWPRQVPKFIALNLLEFGIFDTFTLSVLIFKIFAKKLFFGTNEMSYGSLIKNIK